MFGPYFPGTTSYSDRDRGQGCRLLESHRFDQRPRSLCGCRRSNGECGLSDSGGASGTGTVADNALGQRLGGPPEPGRRRNEFCRWVRPQYLYGGQGANILTYLAIGDGGDRVTHLIRRRT